MIRKKEHGMGLRGRPASRWNGAVAEAGMQVSKHSVELKVQSNRKRRGAGRRGVRVVDWKCPLYTDPELFSEYKVENYEFCNSVGSLATNTKIFFSEICHFTGTVYWGVMLPPSMLRAKGAAIFYSSLAETCSKGKDEIRFWPLVRIPLVSLVHYCRFRYWETKRKTCIQSAKRLTTDL